MTVIAGIDEAGFGPVMGPLVVSAAAFYVPDELLNVSMWQALSGAVCRRPSAKRRSLIPIADSKQLYSGLRGEGGLAHLERGVLAMLSCGSGGCDCLRTLLGRVAPSAEGHASACPWYASLGLPLPHACDPTGILLDANALRARLDRAGIKLLTMRSEVVFESEFNRLVTAMDNKSAMLFDVASRLLMHLWRAIPRGDHARIYVDHQGGRVRYLDGLQRVFEGCQFKVNAETENHSAYTVLDGQRAGDIEFLVEGEDRHLPIALASMLSKYVRELLMVLLNRYWASHLPDLAPTAGYYVDGKRFFSQIRPVIQSLGLDESSLYRLR